METRILRIAAAAGVVLFAVSGGIAYYMSGKSNYRANALTAAEYDSKIGAAQKIISSLPTIEFASRAELVDVLATARPAVAVDRSAEDADAGTQITLSSEEIRQAADVVAELLVERFGAGATPESFAQWRKRSGYRERTMESLRAFRVLDDLYLARMGKPLPEKPEHASTFVEMWRSEPTGGSAGSGDIRINGPLRVVADSRALAVSARNLTEGNPVLPDLREVDLPFEYWHGGSLMGWVSWWEPATPDRELWTKFGRSKTVSFGMVLEYADGQRRPVQVWLVWDPDRSRWFVQGVGVTFFSGDAPGGAVF